MPKVVYLDYIMNADFYCVVLTSNFEHESMKNFGGHSN